MVPAVSGDTLGGDDQRVVPTPASETMVKNGQGGVVLGFCLKDHFGNYYARKTMYRLAAPCPNLRNIRSPETHLEPTRYLHTSETYHRHL